MVIFIVSFLRSMSISVILLLLGAVLPPKALYVSGLYCYLMPLWSLWAIATINYDDLAYAASSLHVDICNLCCHCLSPWFCLGHGLFLFLWSSGCLRPVLPPKPKWISKFWAAMLKSVVYSPSQAPSLLPCSMLWLRAVLLPMVSVTTKGHSNAYDLCYQQKLCWCVWPVM